MQAQGLAVDQSTNLTSAQKQHQKKLLKQSLNDTSRISQNYSEIQQDNHRRVGSSATARSDSFNRLRKLKVAVRPVDHQRDSSVNRDNLSNSRRYDPTIRHQRLQELHQRITERQRRIDERKLKSNTSYRDSSYEKFHHRSEQQSQPKYVDRLNQTHQSDRAHKIYNDGNQGQQTNRTNEIYRGENTFSQLMRYKSAQQSPRRNRSASHHKTYHNLRPERVRQSIRQNDFNRNERSLIHSQDQSCKKRLDLNQSSRSRSRGETHQNSTQVSTKNQNNKRRRGIDSDTNNKQNLEQTHRSHKSLKSSHSRRRDLESRYQMYNDIRSLKKQLSVGIQALQKSKDENKSISKKRWGKNSSRSDSQSKLMTRDTPKSKCIRKQTKFNHKSRSRSNNKFDKIRKRPPIQNAEKKCKLRSSRQMGWTNSFNHDLKSVKSRASKAALGSSFALNRQSYTNKPFRNSSSRFASNQRSAKGEALSKINKTQSRASLVVDSRPLGHNKLKTKNNQKVMTHLRSASKAKRKNIKKKNIKIQAKIPQPKRLDNEQISRDIIAEQYSPQHVKIDERNSSVRNPSMLNSGGTTNDMYSPIAEFKHRSHQIDQFVIDSQLRSKIEKDKQLAEHSIVQDDYNKMLGVQTRSQPMSSGRGSDDQVGHRNQSLDSHSSYGGYRASVGLRSRAGSDSRDRPKKNTVWKQAKRNRSRSSTRATAFGQAAGVGIRSQHGGDQYSQRSTGSKRSIGNKATNSQGYYQYKQKSRQEVNVDKGLEANAEIRADQVQILDNPRPMSMDSNAFCSNQFPSESYDNRYQRALPIMNHDSLYGGSIPTKEHNFNKLSFGLDNFQSKHTNQTTEVDNYDSGSFPLKHLDQHHSNNGTGKAENEAHYAQQRHRFNNKRRGNNDNKSRKNRAISGEKSSGRNRLPDESRSRSSQKRNNRCCEARDKKKTISSSNNQSMEDVSRSMGIFENKQSGEFKPKNQYDAEPGPESVRQIYSQLKQKSGQLNSLLDQLSKLVGP